MLRTKTVETAAILLFIVQSVIWLSWSQSSPRYIETSTILLLIVWPMLCFMLVDLREAESRRVIPCDEIDGMTETLVVVASLFHQDSRYLEFYNRNSDAVGGFPGIWAYCKLAGDCLFYVEYKSITRHRTTEGFEYDWLTAVDDYINAMYAAGVILAGTELASLAEHAVAANTTTNAV